MARIFIGGTNKVDVDFKDVDTALRYISKINNSEAAHYVKEVIGGLPEGPEKVAREWATKFRVPFDEHLPHEELGPIKWVARNKTVVAHADVLLVFWDGKSAGARNLMNAASKRGKMVYMAQCYQKKWNGTISEWVPPEDTDWTSVW
jgi:hypothetical protein